MLQEEIIWTTMDWKGCYLLCTKPANRLYINRPNQFYSNRPNRSCLPKQAISVTPATVSLRKEVIQPQVLLRLPCYDFTPIMNHTLDGYLPCGLVYRLLVQSTFVM